MNLLFKITYGLYVLTSEADGKAGGAGSSPWRCFQRA